MNSLRNRITALLILAIVTVVGLATFAASRALQPPLPQATMEPIARQIHILVSMAERNREDAVASGLRLEAAPASGPEKERLSRFLMRSLEKTGEQRMAIVTESADGPALAASVDLGDGTWLIAEMPDLAPAPGGWVILAGWITLIVIGSTAVSIFAASKIIRPLQLLETAVARIGADGVLPYIPEAGSGELRATAQALNRLSARLKSAMESRMRLVAAAGHDLRTPMTRMRLRAEFISNDEERQKWFADLEELDQIADSAIRLVREEANRDGAQIVRLDRLVHEIVEELGELGYKVAQPRLMSLPVTAGPMALKRALRNLIINAATHGKGAKLDLSRKGETAIVTIADEGPGIPEDLLGQVFEPFFRVDISRRKSIPGAGLGLAIAKEIIERFGGAVSVANRSPKGLVQTVTFPLADSANDQSAESDAGRHDGGEGHGSA
ncbi:ATP-binding protein [Mesorhizobium sp. SB112]|uniref:ATP-binding protein n=1 Tax=Mesorhizobium sp. SB112 TaxID=3151853 RepID=UPI0032633A3C